MLMLLKRGTLLQGGKYEIIKPLGQGGFRITYEAIQVGLGRNVAIKEFFMKEYCDRNDATSKVSVPSQGSKELVSRFKAKFLKEARTIASLDDPNIVTIYDVFEENDTAYYVMEYLHGGSLSDKCKCGAIPEKIALQYIKEIASALSYIHCLPQPMNHLDIKPSNVLLNTKGQAVLIDFGISKRYDETGGQTSSTPVGISYGYSPLEQYRDGGVQHFSPTTDIYSLGATLYKLVTGENPPHATDVLSFGLPDISTSISQPVRNAIERAMQPRIKDRPQSIAEFMSLFDCFERQPSSSSLETGKAEEADINEEATVINVHRKKKANVDNSELIDLGLPSGTMWATKNIGSEKETDFGRYFAWGEVADKDDYRWRTYKHAGEVSFWGEVSIFSKYNNNRKLGNVDMKETLDVEDDVAHESLGKNWQVPNEKDWQELINDCDWVWLEESDRIGYEVRSKSNGNYIFLPAAGYMESKGFRVGPNSIGIYWSSQLSDNPTESICLRIEELSISLEKYYRYRGCTVRPVCK